MGQQALDHVSSDQLSLKLRIGLICFGLLVGLSAVALVALTGLIPGFRWGLKAGQEFESLEDLRRAMLAPDKLTDPELNVDLRALVSPHPSDRIIYQLRSNTSVKFQDVPVSINSCGMRDREHSIAKPPNTYRIALLGDSFSFGWGVPVEDSFGKRLEQNLNRLTAGTPRVEVLNFGVPGYSTFQEVASFLETGIEFDPDAVLVFFIDNDFGLPFYVRDILNPNNEILPGTVFAKRSWRHDNEQIESQRLQLLGYEANRALKQLSDATSERGIKLFFTINPRDDWLETRKKLWILNNSKFIKFINLRKAFVNVIKARAIPDKALVLAGDPHPSILRHHIYGDILTPYFMDLLL